ncbi:hypothetical protein, partial [Vulcanococcus limneticus]
NVRYSILLLCRLFGGFFMSSEPLRFADYSRCPLGLSAHLKRSLPFLFSEFRGLALALRSARDSEAHGFQGEGVSSFNSGYGVMVIRLFDLAERMYGLVLQTAAANREEADQFQFRLVRPSGDEYQPLRAKILAELSQWDSLREAASSGLPDEQGCEMVAPTVREAGYEDFLGSIDLLLSERFSAHNESINGLLEGLRDELSVAREGLRSDLLRTTNSIHALLTTKAENGRASNSVIDPVDPWSRLGPSELTRALLDLRDSLYQQMVHALPGFKHYHSILQKPIISEAVLSGVCTYGDYRLLPQFQNRIIGMSRSFALAKQEELVGNEIEELLARRHLP